MREDWLQVLEKFLRALERRGIRVEEAYAFGSRVRGDWLENSDIDVVIVSEDFKNMKFLERLDLMERIQWEEGITPHVEVLPYTREEFRKKLRESAVLRDASKYWIVIRSKNVQDRYD